MKGGSLRTASPNETVIKQTIKADFIKLIRAVKGNLMSFKDLRYLSFSLTKLSWYLKFLSLVRQLMLLSVCLISSFHANLPIFPLKLGWVDTFRASLCSYAEIVPGQALLSFVWFLEIITLFEFVMEKMALLML